MEWKLNINENCKRTKINIEAPKITDNVTRLTAFIEQLSATFSIKKNDDHYKVSLDQIMYIENVERTTFIYTETKMYEDDRPLYELEELLKEFDFIRINKQTVISPRYIQSVKALFNSRYELVMTSEEKLIVTRHYRKKFKELFEKGGMYDA